MIRLGLNGGFQSLSGFDGQILGTSGGGGGGLQADVPSTCFVLEASNLDSYDGSAQTWSNVVATPADGSPESDFHFYLGVGGSSGTDDPTFTGTAGTPGAYFAFDGGDTFNSVENASDMGFLANAHKTTGGSAFWVAIACRINVGSTKGIFSTQSAATGVGFRVQSASTEEIQLIQRGDSSNAQYNTGYTHDSTTDLLIIISVDAEGGTVRHWINSRTGTSSTITYNTTTSAPAAKGCVGGVSSAASRIPSGSRVYAVASGNALIDDTAAGHIFDYMNTSTGLTFA